MKNPRKHPKTLNAPAVFKSGATEADPIHIEDYDRTAKITVDLTLESDSGDDQSVVEVRYSSSTKRRRFDIGVPSEPIVLSFNCEICADVKPFVDSIPIPGCGHRYCKQCVSAYVAAKLERNNVRIKCPDYGCDGQLDPHRCSTVLPKAVFERWGDALCEAAVLEGEKLYCPFKDCSALLINDGGDKLTRSECPECRRMFCVTCKSAWHAGIDCEEFQWMGTDERSREDVMMASLAKNKGWRRCPGCGVYISRSEGCLQMTCSCGDSFCYKCGGKHCWGCE